MIHKGEGLYDGDFNDLVRKINPKSKLIFEFNNLPSPEVLKSLNDKYNITINENQLTGELEDEKIKLLLMNLLKIDYSKNFKIDELPVEEAMRTFFANPQKFLDE